MFKQLACIALLACAPLASLASNLPDYPFIHVAGAASADVMPDTGQIDFEIAAHDMDVTLALALVDTRATEVRALASEMGIAPDDVEMRDVRKDFRKPEANTPPGQIVYDVRVGVRITVRDLRKWQALAGALLPKPNLDGFISTFDTSQRDKIETELMSDAIKSARRKAQHIAGGLARQLGPVSAVSQGELKNLTRAMGLAPSETAYRDPRRAALDRGNLLVVSLLKFVQSVDVIFRLK